MSDRRYHPTRRSYDIFVEDVDLCPLISEQM
jgi:hypothetical protein